MEEKREIPKVPLFQFLKHSANILKNQLPFHHKNFEAQGDVFTLRLGFKSRIYFSRDAAFAQ